MRRRNNLTVLRGYRKLSGTVGPVYGPEVQAKSGGYSVGQGISDATSLFSGIFNPLVAAKSEREAREFQLKNDQLTMEMHHAQAAQAQAVTAGQIAQNASLQKSLEIQLARNESDTANALMRAKTEKPTLTPVGWGVVGLVGAGVLAVVVTRKKK